MKLFFEEYGLSTVLACAIMFLLVMASPVGGAIKGGLDNSTTSLKDTGAEVQAHAGNSIKTLAGEEGEVSDSIYVGYNSSTKTLVFSHDENSPKYSECNTKYGEINQANKPRNGKSGSSTKSGKGVIDVDLGMDDIPVPYPDYVPWSSHGRTAHTVLIENKIKPYTMNNWFDYYGRNTDGRDNDTGSYYISFTNLSNIDTSNCTGMLCMFRWCYCHSLDLSSWDTRNVENMASMFNGCQVTSISYGEHFVKPEGCNISRMFGSHDGEWDRTYCNANKPSWWH